MNQILNMIMRQFMGQLINRGMRAGFDKAGQMADQRKAARGEPVKAPRDMTPEERRQHKLAKMQAKQARQKMRGLRKF